MDENESYWEVFSLGLRARFFNFKEFFQLAWRYWREARFAQIDCALALRYFFESPYHMNRKLGLELYGETPLTTMQKIADVAKIGADDVVYELGAGRGRTSFWLHHFYACKVCAIEYNPFFVARAKEIQQKYGVEGVEFIHGDMRKVDLSQATCIYLYGTLLADADIKELLVQFKKLKLGTRLITISYSLTDYETKSFRVLSEFEVAFPWGKTTAYLQEVRNASIGQAKNY
jgi:predicted RNA methylase